MGWSIGFDQSWQRDIGYGAPGVCDHPDCNAEIDRGLAHVCGHQQPYGGEDGCGLYFCHAHGGGVLCERCDVRPGRIVVPFHAKPDVAAWLKHKLTDESWADWRAGHPEQVADMTQRLAKLKEQ